MLQKKNLEVDSKRLFPKELFATREAKGEDYYKIMIVNTSLKDYQYKECFPWSLWLSIDLQDKVAPYGMPSVAEGDVLNKLEDVFEKIVQNNSRHHYVGRITHNGNRDIYFYLDNPDDVHKELQKLIESNMSLREFQYVIEEDPTWNQVDIFYNYE